MTDKNGMTSSDKELLKIVNELIKEHKNVLKKLEQLEYLVRLPGIHYRQNQKGRTANNCVSGSAFLIYLWNRFKSV